MIARFKDLCMDATDAHRLGAFWAGILDAEMVDTGDGDTRIDPRAARSGAEVLADPEGNEFCAFPPRPTQ